MLYSFTGGSDGASPAASLVFDPNGNLYGTTGAGGSQQSSCSYNFNPGCGLVFELSPSNGSWNERVLHSFSGYPNDGQQPLSNVVFDSSGNLYGTTKGGGSSNRGTVFELSSGLNGSWTETVLYNFTDQGDGGLPSSGVVLDSSGNLYGAAGQGGYLDCSAFYNDGCGVIFELSNGGGSNWTESVLLAFDFNDGASPVGNLAFDSAGNLYGTTNVSPGFACSFEGCGEVFRLSPNQDGTWTQSILYNFQGGPDGNDPGSGVVLDSFGNLFGTTRTGGGGYGDGTVFELSQTPRGQWTETVLYRFAAGQIGDPDGSTPLAAPLLDGQGNLYLALSQGGSSLGSCNIYGALGSCGTVLKLTPSGRRWSATLLYAFPPGFEGVLPRAGLVADGAGNLYGTTNTGGKNPCYSGDGPNGCGTIFEVQPQSDGSWKNVLLHNFNGIDGASPAGNLIEDAQGNLYGMASSGGSPDCIGYFAACGGTVFELSPSAQGWTLTVLHTFHAPPPGQTGDGSRPFGGLVMDAQGNLYGATSLGGSGSQGCTSGPYVGCGTVFELSPAGDGTWNEKVLYVFQGGTDGNEPFGSLAFDKQGALYGTTNEGDLQDDGTVFQLTPGIGGSWKEKILYSFRGPRTGDGAYPFAGVIVDDNGNLYGTTEDGGSNSGNCYPGGCGIVFELTPGGGLEWTETIIHTFQGTDGSNPEGSLTFDSAGNLYGSASDNSDEGWGGGVVFVLFAGAKGWTERVLHNFGTRFDGVGPNGGLIFGSMGDLFGTTIGGGVNGTGTVFQLSSNTNDEWGPDTDAGPPPHRFRSLHFPLFHPHKAAMPLTNPEAKDEN